MKHIIVGAIIILFVCIPYTIFSQTWGTDITLPSTVAGAVGGAGDANGVHLVGVYEGVAKHFLVSDNGAVVYNNLNITGGEYPVVNTFAGKVFVSMKYTSGGNSYLRIYQSSDGGNTWQTPYEYLSDVPVYNIDAITDYNGTHIVWENATDNYYNHEIYYIRYDGLNQIFTNNKNVTDLSNPSEGGRPKVTTSFNKAHVVFPSSSINVTSRDLNLISGAWDASYIEEPSHNYPYRSISVCTIGDELYSYGPSDIILGGASQITFLGQRNKDGISWSVDHGGSGTYLGTMNRGNLAINHQNTLYTINKTNYSGRGIEAVIYDPVTGQPSYENVESFTGDQLSTNIFLCDGPHGVYYFWAGSSPSFHQHMRKRTDPDVVVNYSMSVWNMASVPNAVWSFAKTALWPNAINEAAWYQPGTGYVNASTLENGKSYWIKFPSTQNIGYTGSSISKIQIPVKANWNMIGSISTILPNTKIRTPNNSILSNVFGYNNGYYTTTQLNPGGGYWVKVASDGYIILDGSVPNAGFNPSCLEQPPNPSTAPYPPTLSYPANGATGVSRSTYVAWNSSYGASSYRLQVSTDICFTTLLVDSPGETYTSVGLGPLGYSTTYYWRVNATNGTVSNWSVVRSFTTEGAPPDPCTQSASLLNLDAVTIVDAQNNSQQLYFQNSKKPLPLTLQAGDELPPVSPQKFFHARFNSGKFIENVKAGNGKKIVPIKLHNASYPLTFKWNLKSENAIDYWLTLPGQGNAKIHLNGTGSYALSQPPNSNIIVTMQAIDPCLEYKTSIQPNGLDNSGNPEQYSLQQNLPNPFNPSTLINYDLPFDGNVSLKVFNSLGQEVATLVNEYQSSGYKSVSFDASSLPSGMYMYRLQSGNFSDTKKMLLVK